MSKTVLTDAHVKVEFIPAHKYLGIRDDKANNYGEFRQGHDCDSVCGTIDSPSSVSDIIVTGHTAGWKKLNGEHKYFYGMGVPLSTLYLFH